jgi:hypothetical protein
MNVPPEKTQAPAQDLVSYDEFLLRLEKLRSSPRVRIDKLGESHGGRGLYCILVASEDTISSLEYHRSLSTALQMPQVVHHTLDRAEIAERPDAEGDVKFPVLTTGLSFGHEASHVEGHLALAERLAWAHDEEVEAILGRLIVLIMPMLNPDGREMSIDIWSECPLAEDSSAGNLYGFYLNRDFLHLTQPEAEAVAKVYKEWHPLALLDTHEDVFCLGVQVPAVCWCPYVGNAPVEEAPDSTLELISRLGEAIRSEWERLGFKYMERNMFAHPMPGEPEEGPYWVALGTVVEAMALHGMPSVITESARTPGTQAWDDRVQQKYAAGMALLKEMARDPLDVAEKMFHNRKSAMDQVQPSHQAYIVPKGQAESDAVARLVDTLLKQSVKIYEAEEPFPSFVVPLAQGEVDVARTLLSTRSSKLAAMAPALGIAVSPLDALSKDEQSTFRKARLTPVVAPPLPVLTILGERDTGVYAIPNSADGVRLINRVWGLGASLHWLTDPVTLADLRLSEGTFLVTDTPKDALCTLAQGLGLNIQMVPGKTKVGGYSLTRPKVALYTGQGVDTPDASARGDISWALDNMGFEYAPLKAEDFTLDMLAGYDVLIVPCGDAHEIVHGWDTKAVLNSSPWELPGEPLGIGQEGLEALRDYVRGGGLYLGIGSGGGLLALDDYAGLIDLQVMAHSLGTARVLLRVDRADHPLMFGLGGYYNEDGTWTEGYFPAQYHSETFTTRPGGPVFKPGPDSTALASYYRVDHDPERLQIINESFLTEAEGGVAIAHQQVGKGQVVVIGVRPGFRALWTNTWKLISNAVFLSSAKDKKQVSLP